MVAYNDSGRGYPIVLLHGFCEDKSVWKYIEKNLAQKFRVITPDLPGFGESVPVDFSFSMESFAESVHELVLALKLEKFIIVGHSLGGYVALAYAEKFEYKIDGLGLFHSTAFEDTEEKKENRLKAIEFIEKFGVRQFSESFVPPLFSLKNRALYKDEIKELVEVAANTNDYAVVETSKAMRVRKERISVLRKLNVPVLFVIGKLDGAIPFERSMEQCSIPKNSVVHILDGIGHMGMIENKSDSERILASFVAYCI